MNTFDEIMLVAEREGFEPSVELSPHTRLAGERLQPTRPSLRESTYVDYNFLIGSCL